MECLDVSFEISACAYNVITKVFLPQEVALSLLIHASVGQNLYEDLIHDCLASILSVWDPMKKCQLKTSKTNKIIRKQIKMKFRRK